MSEFNRDNLVKNLPDCYCKDESGNNYKILEIEKSQTREIEENLRKIYEWLDIDNARGTTLDEYGNMFGQERGNSTDEQYILKIKAKIIRNLSGGSCNNLITALSTTFNCEKSDIYLKESESGGKVEYISLPLTTIFDADMTLEDATALIRQAMPVGINLGQSLYNGTFEFSDVEDEYNEDQGFSEKENGTIGGYLGSAG